MSSFRETMIEEFRCMAESCYLYETDIDMGMLWCIAKGHIDEGCRDIVSSIGNVVSIRGNMERSIFDGLGCCGLSDYVKGGKIRGLYLSSSEVYGVSGDYVKGELEIPVYRKSHADMRAKLVEFLGVVSEESLEIALRFISDGTLICSIGWQFILTKLLRCRKEYDSIGMESGRDRYLWCSADSEGVFASRVLRNSMGVFLRGVTAGEEEIMELVGRYNRDVLRDVVFGTGDSVVLV